ncbi:uncharacterized protein LOC129237019 [Anastrepha obliqua]|uniref:uncharacterized protein LOC129237019 n=1 Tax=Anastrepha obliqua TaxID=95512 RepID=UPI00240A060B|nr:uncharacterized protein LOC129237019 [Anastrepha obliqua]
MDRFLVKADGTQYGAIRKEPTIPVSSKSVISSSDESDGSASEDVSKNCKQKFRPHWKNLHRWLDTKEGKSYCVICKKILANNITNIKRHGEGESHKKRQAALRNQIKLSDVKERCYATKNAIKIAELKIILFLCIYDLPFTLIPPLIELIKSVAANTNVIKGLKCGRTKAKETVTNTKQQM